jgi:hypothetical protein
MCGCRPAFRDDERFGAWLIGIGLRICRALLGARDRQASSLETLLDERRLAEPLAAGDSGGASR